MVATVKFVYKTIEYEFRRPTLGNSDELSFQRINRRSRGGDLIIFRDDEWPKTETLNLRFVFFKEKELQDFKAFMDICLGDIVEYTDHEDTVWSGLIQNPDAEAAQTGRYSYEITIVFEGDQV